ncbi:sensor domain-containing diguanylate cyclase [Paenibacillus hamazuiensis]|uniref:sensor domain-containing diguanylate cyclase n=1 Tax=Paenibacillus hamazuiensis TaxID=2936508 RepID=UPI00200F90C1|nr:sensor domain-containing diguanylate cyclase [Paenibacillus hamazuiensis]
MLGFWKKRRKASDPMMETYKSMIDRSPDAIVVFQKNKAVLANRSAVHLLGAANPDRLTGISVFDFIHPDDTKEAAEQIMRLFRGEPASLPFEYKFTSLKGGFFPVEGAISRIRYDGRPALMMTFRDITERKAAELRLKEEFGNLQEMNRKLMEQSRQDGLTGVANRRSFEETFERTWKESLRTGTPLSVIMCDIDHFKAYNDRFGHQMGDACLKEMANALRSALKRPNDFIARYGGEEFVILLPDTDEFGMSVVAERIHEAVLALAIPHGAQNDSGLMTVSLGAAVTVPQSDGNPQDILEAADRGLYQAKKFGRNRTEFYPAPGTAELLRVSNDLICNNG